MKRKVAILVCLLFGAGCGKHSDTTLQGAVSNITCYNQGMHSLTIESFAYNGPQLVTYTNQVIDSLPSMATETQVYRFQYLNNALAPSSYSITDTFSGAGYSPSLSIWSETYALRYDARGRVVSDSLTDSTGTWASCCGPVPLWAWNYSDLGIGVHFKNINFPGMPLVDSLVFSGGNLDSYMNSETVFGPEANPLYNPAYANSIGLILFDTQRSFLGWLPFAVDLLSKNLPASSKAPLANDDRLLFAWRTRFIRVTGATVTDTYNGAYGPLEITISYY
jgi:hypothetical protein